MNFKKLTFIIPILIASTLMVGCSNNIEKDAINQGRDALTNSNYEEAVKVFDFALQNNPNNEEIKKLQNLTDTYLKAEQAFKNINYKECKELIQNLENNTNKALISNDLEILKQNLNKVEENNKYFNESISKIETFINNEKFSEAKKLLEKINSKEIPQEYMEKINSLVSKVNDGIKKNNKKIEEEEGKKLTCDEALNLLKANVNLSQDQYYKLSSKNHYTLDNGSQAYVINKYYKPKNSTKEQLISQYYIDVLNGKITEEIAGIKKEIN